MFYVVHNPTIIDNAQCTQNIEHIKEALVTPQSSISFVMQEVGMYPLSRTIAASFAGTRPQQSTPLDVLRKPLP